MNADTSDASTGNSPPNAENASDEGRQGLANEGSQADTSRQNVMGRKLDNNETQGTTGTLDSTDTAHDCDIHLVSNMGEGMDSTVACRPRGRDKLRLKRRSQSKGKGSPEKNSSAEEMPTTSNAIDRLTVCIQPLVNGKELRDLGGCDLRYSPYREMPGPLRRARQAKRESARAAE